MIQLSEIIGQAGVSFSGFGFDSSANTRITDTDISLEGTVVNLQIGSSDSEVLRLNILGEHQAMNAAAALEVSEFLGLDRVQSFEALEKMELAERWRMQLTKTPRASTSLTMPTTRRRIP